MLGRKDAGRGLSGEIKGCSSTETSTFHSEFGPWSFLVSLDVFFFLLLSFVLPRVAAATPPVRLTAVKSQSSNEEM
jgi:hypothetical protein